MKSPTMSMKDVIMRIHSLLLSFNFMSRGLRWSFGGRLSQCGGRHRSSDHSREGHDREHVRDHLHELTGNRMRSLQADLKRLRRGEKETRESGSLRIPPPENRGGKCDESASRGHAVRELMLVERQIGTAQRRQHPAQCDRDVTHASHGHADRRSRGGMLAHRTNPEPERRTVQNPGEHRQNDDSNPHERIVREREKSCTGAPEAGHARRVGGASKEQAKEETCQANGKKIDRDADAHLVTAKANGADGIHQREHRAAHQRRRDAEPRRATREAHGCGAERAAKHVSLEPERNKASSLAQHAAGRRQQEGNGDAQGLRQEVERAHVAVVWRAERSMRRTSGTDVATARMTTACSTSIICLGTRAFTTRPPCDSVAKRSAATTMPTGWLRPTSATAMPRYPAPDAKPSS